MNGMNYYTDNSSSQEPLIHSAVREVHSKEMFMLGYLSTLV